MKKKQFLTILLRATVALIIPVLGQYFVNGWNWGFGDFVFAWVFFSVLGIVYTVATNNIVSRFWRMVAAIAIIAVFAFVWIKLATG